MHVNVSFLVFTWLLCWWIADLFLVFNQLTKGHLSLMVSDSGVPGYLRWNIYKHIYQWGDYVGLYKTMASFFFNVSWLFSWGRPVRSEIIILDPISLMIPMDISINITRTPS